jgi:alkylhydroperoxidase family enzyme
MSNIQLHTIESAPEASKALLEQSVKDFGMLPNLHAAMAGSPQLLEGYKVLHTLFAQSSFNAEELTVVWQTINVEHNCHYCVPAHTGIAHMMKVDPALTEALRNQEKMPTDKLQVLHETTLLMLRNRGELSDAQIQTFFAAGFTQANLLDIILGLAQKVMSNYTNHITHTPVDPAFEKFTWQKKA